MTGLGTQVIVLNGTSSAGKTSIAQSLQQLLAPSWLCLGIDDLIRAMPDSTLDTDDGLTVAPDGSVSVGSEFRRVELGWYEALATIARGDIGLIVDEVFLGGAESQERLATALVGLRVLWVGVHCDPSVAAQREAERGDRVAGMAQAQAPLVHRGVAYDLQVDTTETASLDCARLIIDRMAT